MTTRSLLNVLIFAALTAGCASQSSPQQTPSTPLAPPPAPVTMQKKIIGQSVEGRPIALHLFGDGPIGTLVIAGVHGDETTAIACGEQLVRLLEQEKTAKLPSAVAVIPLANPDAAVKGRRTNARMVDINRNFPASNWAKTRKGSYHGGPSAVSEPETVALRDAVLSLQPRQIVSIHSISRGRHCNNYDGPGESLARRMALHNGYPATATIGYPTPGSFGSWAGNDLKIPVITLELPRDLPADKAWEGNREALLEALK